MQAGSGRARRYEVVRPGVTRRQTGGGAGAGVRGSSQLGIRTHFGCDNFIYASLGRGQTRGRSGDRRRRLARDRGSSDLVSGDLGGLRGADGQEERWKTSPWTKRKS